MKALQRTFIAYGESLHRVEVFKYLGHLVSYDDVNTQAIRGNLKKCRKTWARISKVLRAEYASPRVCGMFYRATVQSILLYGSETWTVAPANLAMMEGFHVHTARRMAGHDTPYKGRRLGIPKVTGGLGGRELAPVRTLVLNCCEGAEKHLRSVWGVPTLGGGV